MPQYDTYEDESKNIETFPILDEVSEVTRKWGDHCISAEILLPEWDKIARVQVVHQKHYADGNPIDRSNENPTLDTCL